MILLFVQLFLYKKVWFKILKTIILYTIFVIVIIINKMGAGFLLLIFIHYTFKLGYNVNHFL